MTQSPISSAKYSQKSKFVSCIRINGVPILPPLITPEKRKELRRLKREAIKIEKRLLRERELKAYVSHLYQTCTTDLNDATFAEFENNESILNDLTSKESQTTQCLDRTHLVIENNINLHDIHSNLTFTAAGSNIDQTEQTGFARKLFFDLVDDDVAKFRNTEPSIVNQEQIDNIVIDVRDAESIVTSKESTLPKLIRSNSYTLEAPSPALVEYFKTSKSETKPTSCWELDLTFPQQSLETYRSESKDECDNYSQFIDNHDTNSTLTNILDSHYLDNETFIQNVTTTNDIQITSLDATPRIENFQKTEILEVSERFTELSVFEDCNENELNSSRTETELRNLSDCESHLQEFIVNNVHQNDTNCNYQDISTTETQLSESPRSENASVWDNILKQIPSAYSRQILELLERQQTNQNITQDFEAFDQIQHNPEKYSTPHDTTTTQSVETVYYTVKNEEELNLQIDQENSTNLKFNTSGSTLYEDAESKTKDVDEQVLEEEKRQECGKEKLSRDKAASLLTAAARGFLVRRLMKTEKVQYLIQTINETVLCAMQLHHDTLDHIEEADVELHRRLIQQVSAACYSFHSVFFATSIQDQMSFIAVDRQKKIEKQRRISSANSSVSLRSNKSSTRRNSRRKLLRL